MTLNVAAMVAKPKGPVGASYALAEGLAPAVAMRENAPTSPGAAIFRE
jgi:hypothetical protein